MSLAGRCARRRTHFLLLRQKKVSKEKATPLPVSLRFAPGNLRCSCLQWCCGTRFALARSAQTAAASQMTMLGHVPLPKPTAVTALLGTGRGDPEETCASIALKTKRCACAGTFPVPVPVPVSAPTPFGCACGARLAGWRLHRRMQTLREHARRICPSGARSAKRVMRRTPQAARRRFAPKRSAGVADSGVAFFCLLFLAKQEK